MLQFRLLQGLNPIGGMKDEAAREERKEKK